VTPLLLCGGVAHAGGIEVGDQGARAMGRAGAFTARADDPSAAYYNPAGLARQRGTQLYYSHRLVYGEAECRRARTLDWSGATHGVPRLVDFEHVENEDPWFPLGLMLVAASDLGLDDWTFAAGVYGPPGVGHVRYPADGPQRYMLVEMTTLILYYTLSAAWKYGDLFGVGLSLQWVDVPQLDFEMVVDGVVAPRNVSPDQSQFDINTRIEGSDRFGLTAIVGAWLQPHPAVDIGVAGRVLPVKVETASELHLRPDFLELDRPISLTRDGEPANDVSFSMVLPPKLRGGIRYAHRCGGQEMFDVELGVHYEMWSMVERFTIDADITSEVMGQVLYLDTVEMEKRWKDTWSVRLGGDYHVVPDLLTVRGGFWYETPAVDDAYAYLDALSFERWGPSAGLTLSLWGFEASAAYSYIFQEVVVVSEDDAAIFQQVPGSPCPAPYTDPALCHAEYLGKPSAPANAGTYRASYHVLNLSLSYGF